MSNQLTRTRGSYAFTLIELLVVISIIAMLTTLLFPVTSRIMDQVNASKCQHNLRQLGVVIQTAATDNNGTYPVIENDPNNPIHEEGEKVWTLPELVQSRGASLDILKCPADEKSKLAHPKNQNATASYHAMLGSSYEWVPLFEGENVTTPRLFTRFGTRNVPPKRVRLAMDYAENGEAPHNRDASGSSMHVLYADGSVRTVTLTKAR